MSEYQYEFQAIDRPLTGQQAEVAMLSSGRMSLRTWPHSFTTTGTFAVIQSN